MGCRGGSGVMLWGIWGVEDMYIREARVRLPLRGSCMFIC
jgi:hypothetical protein